MKYHKNIRDQYELWVYPQAVGDILWVVLHPEKGAICSGVQHTLEYAAKDASEAIHHYERHQWFELSANGDLGLCTSEGYTAVVRTRPDADRDIYASCRSPQGKMIDSDYYESVEDAKEGVVAFFRGRT